MLFYSVKVKAQPHAEFIMSSSSTCVNTEVDFTSLSYGGVINWLWDFGDGNTSDEINPEHIYDNPGSYTITLTVTDGNGLTDSYSENLIVRPPKAEFTAIPTLGSSIPHTVFFTDQSTLPDIWLWNFGDGGTSTVKNPVHTYISTGEFTVNLKVTDTIYGCNNSYSKIIRISNPDANFTPASNFGCGPLNVNFTDTSVADGAPIVSWNWDLGDGTTSANQNPSHTYTTSGSYNVTLTIIDDFGNSDTKTLNSSVQVIGPDVDFTADVTSGTGCPLTVSFNDNTVFEAAATSWTWNFGDGTTSSLQNPTHSYSTSGTFDVSLTVLDNDSCSKTLTKTAFINNEDNSDPVITCPVNVTINTDIGLCTSTADIGSVIATDDCGSPAITNNAPSTFSIGNTTVIWTATDAAGNTTICTQIVTVADTEDPAITCPSAITINTDAGQCTSTTLIGTATATDNCSVPTVSNDAPIAFPIGDTTVTWTAIDTAGNTATCNQIVTVVDIENPIITCPTAITINTDAGQCTSTTSIGTATATDNCGIPTVSNNAPIAFSIGNTTVIWTATDAAGNTATCNQIVTVVDIENPIITCPTAITINTDAGQCTSTTSIGTATATDNCDVPTVSNDAPIAFPIGDTTVTWAAIDTAGNMATCTQTVTVEDIEDPIITCPAAITLNTDSGQCDSTASIGIATATDNCGIPTVSNDAPIAFPIGNTTVIWTATDAAGNTATCNQIVTVADTEDPAITCPSAITINTDAGQCTSTTSIGTATATDNCGVTTVSNDAPIAFPIGDTTVTWTAIDTAGNTATCNQIVTVVDIENPIITCPTAITINTDAGQCTSTTSIGIATATDNCGVPTVSNDAPIAFPIGNTTVIWTATDPAGNTATCTQIVTVEDTENPVVIVTQNIIVTLDASGNTAITPAIVDNGSFDNCNIAAMALDITNFDCSDIGNPIAVMLTVSDASGNSSNATTLVTVQDNSDPVAISQDITVSLDPFGNASITPAMIDNGSYDNCGIANMALDTSIFKCPELDEEQIVILTITDNNGNTSSTNAIISFSGFDLDLDGIADSCDTSLNPDVIPNLGISPNNDGQNDTWFVKNITDFPYAIIEVFDRNGVKVFNTTNYQNDWNGNKNGNGSKVPVGSYYYSINIFGNGSLYINGWLYINY